MSLSLPESNDPKQILSQTKPNVDQFNQTDKNILKNIHDQVSMDIDKLNGLLKDIHVEDVPKSQWKILQAKHNIDPDEAKLDTQKFDALNALSKNKNRSLGGYNYVKHTENPPKIDPSQTSSEAAMRNKQHEDFWKIKDPSRIAITAFIKDSLGYDDSADPHISPAQVKNADSEVYQDGSKHLEPQDPAKNFLCFLPVVKKLQDPNEPLDKTNGCNVDQLKLQKQRLTKDFEGLLEEEEDKMPSSKFGSMDPNDQPRDMNPKPKNQIQKNWYYMPKDHMNINGHDLVPTIKAPNAEMAKKFMAIMNEFLSKEQPQVNFNNSPDIPKSNSMKQAEMAVTDADVGNNDNEIMDFDKKAVLKRGDKRFKVKVDWKKPLKKIGNVNVETGKNDQYKPHIKKEVAVEDNTDDVRLDVSQ